MQPNKFGDVLKNVQAAPLSLPQYRYRPAHPGPKVAPYIVLCAIAVVQLIFAYVLLTERRQEETTLSYAVPMLEERFNKISVVLRYLVDKAKEEQLKKPVAERMDMPPLPSLEDEKVVEVTEDKLNLRSGPNFNSAPVMTVSKGARLVVEKEEGEWAQVITPSGTRAYAFREYLLPVNPG